jgi:hypothetical protein
MLHCVHWGDAATTSDRVLQRTLPACLDPGNFLGLHGDGLLGGIEALINQ